jgi:hypothetical protein
MIVASEKMNICYMLLLLVKQIIHLFIVNRQRNDVIRVMIVSKSTIQSKMMKCLILILFWS